MKLLPQPGLNRSIALVFIGVLVPASLGYMYYDGNTPEVTILHFEGAPPGIVFIADLHVREANAGFMERTIDEINALHPSVVLIGGDFTYRGEEDLPYLQALGRIHAPVYAILGNHDYQTGLGTASVLEKMRLERESIDLRPGSYNVSAMQNEPMDPGFAESVTRELGKAGVRVLKNEAVTLDIQGKKLLVVGLDDCWAGRSNPPPVDRTGAFTIYLIHEPGCRAEWDADLVLAGHTHGGQFMLGIPQVLDAAGVVELSGMKMRTGVPTYITRGIGTSNSGPQLRFLASPEIVIINPVSGP